MIGLRAQTGALFVQADHGFTFSGGPNYKCLAFIDDLSFLDLIIANFSIE